ncbi:MAG: transporter substrate-binding domain-containing protein [Oscillospiraceae bacterium]
MKNTKTLIALLLATTMFAGLLAGCGKKPASSASDLPAEKTADDLEYIKTNGKLVIGYTLAEPMNFKDDSGELTGFDTEFAKAVCKKLDLTPEFVEINWDTKEIELNAKNIDCIWNGMTIDADRKANMEISVPYVKNMQVVVIKSDKAKTYTDVASLEKANLTAEVGSAGEKTIAGDASLSKGKYVGVGRQTDALLEVKAGTSDAAVLDWTLANAMVGEGTDFADLQIIPNLELAVEEYGIGFRKGSTACAKVNEVIAELVADGTLTALAEKYGLSLITK